MGIWMTQTMLGRPQMINAISSKGYTAYYACLFLVRERAYAQYWAQRRAVCFNSPALEVQHSPRLTVWARKGHRHLLKPHHQPLLQYRVIATPQSHHFVKQLNRTFPSNPTTLKVDFPSVFSHSENQHRMHSTPQCQTLEQGIDFWEEARNKGAVFFPSFTMETSLQQGSIKILRKKKERNCTSLWISS